MRRWTWSSLLVVACCTTASACSGDSSKSANLPQESTTTPAAAVAVTSAPATVDRPTVELPTVELPALDPGIGELAAAQLDDPAIAAWLDEALTAVPDGDEPCVATVDTMPSAVVAATAGLSDEVIGELMFNLDGALGGLDLACDSGDEAAIDAEAADARAISIAIQQRLREIQR